MLPCKYTTNYQESLLTKAHHSLNNKYSLDLIKHTEVHKTFFLSSIQVYSKSVKWSNHCPGPLTPEEALFSPKGLWVLMFYSVSALSKPKPQGFELKTFFKINTALKWRQHLLNLLSLEWASSQKYGTCSGLFQRLHSGSLCSLLAFFGYSASPWILDWRKCVVNINCLWRECYKYYTVFVTCAKVYDTVKNT